MAWLPGWLGKLIVSFLARLFKDWRADKAREDLGATRERERQGKATVDVLEKNADAVAEADAMSDEEMRRRLTNGN